MNRCRSSVLQPDSPEAKVQIALESANKSRLVSLHSKHLSIDYLITRHSSPVAYFILSGLGTETTLSSMTSLDISHQKKRRKRRLPCLIRMIMATPQGTRLRWPVCTFHAGRIRLACINICPGSVTANSWQLSILCGTWTLLLVVWTISLCPCT